MVEVVWLGSQALAVSQLTFSALDCNSGSPGGGGSAPEPGAKTNSGAATL